jgi:hypothetical protein
MGWDGVPYSGPLTTERIIDIALGAERAGRVLASARKGNVVYAAILEADGDGVYGAVVLTERERGKLWTKVITDDMEPSEDQCPAHVLALLSEPTNDYGRAWRRRCREALVRAAIRERETSR